MNAGTTGSPSLELPDPVVVDMPGAVVDGLGAVVVVDVEVVVVVALGSTITALNCAAMA